MSQHITIIRRLETHSVSLVTCDVN